MSYITKNAYLWVIFSLSLVGGCSSRIPDNLTPVSVARVAEASAWEMQGKLAVSTPDDKFSTNLYWLHTQQGNRLKLTTMLGTTLLSLTTEAGVATLEVDGQRYTDTDPQRLLSRVAGWHIPVDALPLWLTGQLTSDDRVLSRDSQGRPKQILSENASPPWEVEFLSWQRQSGAELPRLLRLKRGDIRLKLQLNHWQALTRESLLVFNRPQSHSGLAPAQHTQASTGL